MVRIYRPNYSTLKNNNNNLSYLHLCKKKKKKVNLLWDQNKYAMIKISNHYPNYRDIYEICILL